MRLQHSACSNTLSQGVGKQQTNTFNLKELFINNLVIKLIMKHFQEKQARIASLYLPLYGLILDNMPRFFLRDLFPMYITASDQVRVKMKDPT